jgi:Flp pilus assembly protein TadD
VGLATLAAAAWWTIRPLPQVAVPADLATIEPDLRAYVGGYIDQVREAPRSWERHGELGLVYEANDRWEEARVAFRVARDLAPSDEPHPAYHLALVTFQAGDPVGATAVLREVVREHPSFAPALHRLGVALLDAGRPEEAAPLFERVMKLEPGDAAGYVGLAETRIRAGDFPRAVELLEQALKAAPRNGTARYLLGTALRGLGRMEEAERELSLAEGAGAHVMVDDWTLRIPPHARQIQRRMARATAFMDAGRHAEAVQQFEDILDSHPGNPDVMNNLAVMHVRMGDQAAARAWLLRCEAANPTHVPTAYNLALVERDLGLLDDALVHAESAVQASPRVATYHVMRASILTALGRHADATGSWRAATTIDASVLEAQLGLAESLFAQGRVADAAGSLAIARGLAPADPDVADLAARIAAAP